MCHDRTIVTMHNAWGDQVALHEETLRYYRDSYAGTYAAKLGVAGGGTGSTHPNRAITNCCNCGAPRVAQECSYCKSVTP